MHPTITLVRSTSFESPSASPTPNVVRLATPAMPELVGSSALMQRVRDRIERAATSRATVLISGESGTGKELVARALHRLGDLAQGDLVEVNCAAIPDALWESELFGYQRGAFTGAEQQRDGWLAAADGGTLFLDEIGEIPPALQAKLLRVLETRTFTAIGSRKPRALRTRFVCATNKDLATAVRQGTFRTDLYYRLNVVTVALPPLRDRREDIPELVRHFVAKLRRQGSQIEGFTPAATALLSEHSWPGNVRELENLIERLAVLKGDGVVSRPEVLAELDDAGFAVAAPAYDERPRGAPSLGPLKEVVGQLEKDLIAEALRCTGGNKNRAAQILGINRTTLVEKLKRVGEAA